MQTIGTTLAEYVAETRHLDAQPTSTEPTFYPAIKTLIAAVLKEGRLPFEVRVNTSESKGKARDMPDFVLGDDKMFVGVFGEVKRANVTLTDIAKSTEQNDQVGRYLAQTGVMLLCNVRGFGLLACVPDYVREISKPVPPSKRTLVKTVDLWSAASGSGLCLKIDEAATADLVEIIERSVTDYAPIADPADLAKVLARQARDAKGGLPDDLRPVRPLLDDYRQALGLAFHVDDERGDRFFRSSLVQTAFYSLFAAWISVGQDRRRGCALRDRRCARLPADSVSRRPPSRHSPSEAAQSAGSGRPSRARHWYPQSGESPPVPRSNDIPHHR
jgi:hypothetical protein